MRSYCFSKHSRLSFSMPMRYSAVINYTAWLKVQEQVSRCVMPSEEPTPPYPDADKLSNKGMSNYSGSVASK